MFSVFLLTTYLVTKVMSQAMHVHADVLKRRAEASLEA
jgi:hypothetical protein